MTATDVVEALTQHRRRSFRPATDLLPEAVGDLCSNNAFAQLVGAAFDRGMPWMKAWQIPYEIQRKGMLDPHRLAQMSHAELKRLLESLPYLPRYGADQGARTLRDCAVLTMEHGGDASAIWRSASPKDVERLLRSSIYGMGRGIAQMLTRLLWRDYRAFRGYEREIDVNASVQVRRVFKRAGLTRGDSAEEAVEAARRLYPACPGELDWPAWNIGQQWCTASAPLCSDCPITAVCPKRI